MNNEKYSQFLFIVGFFIISVTAYIIEMY